MPGSTPVATTLAYVRTEDGVVQLDAGDPVPDNATPEHVEHLTRAGVLTEVEGGKGPTVEDVLAEVDNDPTRAAAALDQEKAGKNRKTLVESLEAIASRTTEG